LLNCFNRGQYKVHVLTSRFFVRAATLSTAGLIRPIALSINAALYCAMNQ
jgi:hypothetical protein